MAKIQSDDRDNYDDNRINIFRKGGGVLRRAVPFAQVPDCLSKGQNAERETLDLVK